jgi:hypothetical protein
MVRSSARSILPFIAGLFVACTLVQVFLAGLGVFDGPRNFITHRDFGYTFGFLILVLLALALAGRAPRRITGLVLLLVGQFTLQSVFIALRADMPQVAALHPVNGFLILLVGVVVTREAWALRRISRGAAVAPAAEPAVEPAGARAVG